MSNRTSPETHTTLVAMISAMVALVAVARRCPTGSRRGASSTSSVVQTTLRSLAFEPRRNSKKRSHCAHCSMGTSPAVGHATLSSVTRPPPPSSVCRDLGYKVFCSWAMVVSPGSRSWPHSLSGAKPGPRSATLRESSRHERTRPVSPKPNRCPSRRGRARTRGGRSAPGRRAPPSAPSRARRR